MRKWGIGALEYWSGGRTLREDLRAFLMPYQHSKTPILQYSKSDWPRSKSGNVLKK
jgi:hypothetical protein